MTTAKYLRGSVHIIIVVCLVVALLGALGFAIYQNFIVKNTTTSTAADSQSSSTTKSTTNTTPTVKLVEGTIDASFQTNLSFTYPETWKYVQTIDGTIETDGTWQQITTITSPSGKYVVTYNVGAGGGLGGTCVPEETGTIATTGYQALAKFGGVSYVELTYKDMPSDSTRRFGAIELLDSATASSLKIGDSSCATAFHQIVVLKKDAPFVQMLAANLKINNVTTTDQFKSALSGAEYEQAKAILLSTTH